MPRWGRETQRTPRDPSEERDLRQLRPDRAYEHNFGRPPCTREHAGLFRLHHADCPSRRCRNPL